jgi:predicted nicotinamide N-methyase
MHATVALEQHVELLTLLRIGGRAMTWVFSEDADSLMAAQLPSLPASGAMLRIHTVPAGGGDSSSCGTGGRVWHSAPVLCRWLLDLGNRALSACNILDIGSGTGAVGLYAASLSQTGHVVLSDGDESLLPLLDANIRANASLLGTSVSDACARIKASLLRWGVHEHLLRMPTTAFDWVLGSDVIYSSDAHAALCCTLRHLIRRSQAHGTHPPRIILCTMPRHRLSVPSRAEGGPFYAESALMAFSSCAAQYGLRVIPASIPGAREEVQEPPIHEIENEPVPCEEAGGYMWSAAAFRDASPVLVEVVEGEGPKSMRLGNVGTEHRDGRETDGTAWSALPAHTAVGNSRDDYYAPRPPPEGQDPRRE